MNIQIGSARRPGTGSVASRNKNVPTVQTLFGVDSDDEQEEHPKAKRARPETAAAINPKVQEVADRLAEFVAKNGRQFEDMTRERNPGDTPFRFLHNTSSKEYQYYQSKLKEHTAKLSQSVQPQADLTTVLAVPPPLQAAYPPAPPAAVPPASYGSLAVAPPPLPPLQTAAAAAAGSRGTGRSRWQSGSEMQAPTSATALPATAATAPATPPTGNGAAPSAAEIAAQLAAAKAAAVAAAAAAAAAPSSAANTTAASVHAATSASSMPNTAATTTSSSSRPDTISAMEAYAKRLEEQRAADAAEAEEEDRKRKARPFLKDTAYDRRKVVAVYKDDGSRGHHMQDFIPQEEMAKFLAQCGDSNAKVALEHFQERNAIGADNIGHKLLQKMGWKEGEGIGASGLGITTPVAATAAGVKQDNLGLGAAAHGAVEDTDDAFEQYRKRMMLGYKYRPNPLGNPRKQYY
eukprot:jgi/Chrzof1/2843/Cz12g00250.t1